MKKISTLTWSEESTQSWSVFVGQVNELYAAGWRIISSIGDPGYFILFFEIDA